MRSPSQSAKLLQENCGASLSACRRYRYVLWRRWEQKRSRGLVMFIGLNPSTADEVENDTTITKCIGLASRWGYGGIVMVNMFAFRATYPRDMVASEDPTGPDNDAVFGTHQPLVKLVVAAWGGGLSDRHRRELKFTERTNSVLQSIGRPVYCLGRTADGSPRHPSRVSYDIERELFWRPSRKRAGALARQKG